jgi:hypothetical protein
MSEWSQKVTNVQGTYKYEEIDTGEYEASVTLQDYPNQNDEIRKPLTVGDLLPYNYFEDGSILEIQFVVNVRQLPKRTKSDYVEAVYQER